MTNKKEIPLTEDGLNKLIAELEYLKKTERPRIITALKEAREQGDLSENAEYDSARNEQAVVEARVLELEAMLENAIVVDDVLTDKVMIGNKVTVKYVANNELEEYSIVGSIEADPFLNKISNESPIAMAILNKKVGNTVIVESPQGQYEVKIMAIK